MNAEFFSIANWSEITEGSFWNELKTISKIEFMKTKIKFEQEEVCFNNTVRISSINYYNINSEENWFELKKEKKLVHFISLKADWTKEDTEEEDLGAKYLGTSLVFFPIHKECNAEDNSNSKKENKKYEIEPTGILVAMGMGTGDSGPDKELVSNPGHIRRFEGMVNNIKNKIEENKSLIWFREEPLKHKPVPNAFIKKVEELFGAKAPALEWRKDSKGGYGQYLYAIAALKFKNDGNLSDNQKEILNGFVKFYARERGLTKGAENDFAKDWYRSFFNNPNIDEIKKKLEKHKYLILSGPPGTKKTKIINEIAEKFYKNRNIIIQFHPNTTYQNFVGGIQPILNNSNDNKDLNFEFKKGPLIDIIENATKNSDNDHLLVIDEINRADLSTVLGEAINLFEPTQQYKINIVNYEDRELTMPDNLHILCAMNTADRNISSIDVAIRRRFAFINIWPTKPENKKDDDYGCTLFNELNDLFLEYGNANDLLLMPGGFYFLGENEDKEKENIKTRLLPLLEDYLYENRISKILQNEIKFFIQKTKLAL